MQYEYEAVKKLNICWDTFLFSTLEPSYTFMIHINPKLPTILQWLKVYRWVLKKRRDYDIILFRNIKADFIGWIFMRFFKQIITVHHTKEIEECKLVQPGYYGTALTWLEKTFGKKKLRHVKGIVAVTEEIAKYELKRINVEKPTLVIPNGIHSDLIKPIPDRRNKNPKAIFISSNFDTWQGLDLILHSYIQNPDSQLELHLVGHVEEKFYYLIQQINKQHILIHLHGTLLKYQLEEILSLTDIGLGSFALFRKGLTEACTLKIREYLSGGIPVFAGHKDSGLPPDFPYYFRGEPDIIEIEKHARKCRTIPRKKIADAALPYIDKAKIIERAYRNLGEFC